MKEKRFRRGARKLLGLVLAAGLMLGGSATAWADAVSTYSISMGQGVMSVLKGGKVTNSFKVANNDVTATTDWEGDLMVCFNNAQGDYVGVALGSQEIINFYGTIGTLLLDESLDRPVVIGPSARVTKLKVKAPVKVSIWGRVDNGIVEAAASLVTAKGSQTSNISFEDSSARIYINEGSVVDGTTIRSSEDLGGNRYGNSSTSSSKTVSGITLKTNTIYADYDDTLGELLESVGFAGMEEGLTINDAPAQGLDQRLSPGDRIGLEAGATATVQAPPPPESRPVPPPPPPPPPPPIQPPKGTAPDIRVIINGGAYSLPPKADGMPYQFFDLLNFVDIDPNEPRGEIVLERNGATATYLDLIQDQDQVEIHWSEDL